MLKSLSISLDKKFIFLVMVVSVVTLTTTAFLTYNFSENILKERVEEQLISESATRGEAIRTLFDTRIKETQILSTNIMIQKTVDELNQIHNDTELEVKTREKRRDLQTEVKAFRELVGYSIGFIDAKIIGKEGNIYFSLGSLSKENFSDDLLFKRGLKEPFVKLEPTFTGGHIMIVTTPIFAQENSLEPIGVIVAKMSTVDMDKTMLNRGGLGETGEVYLVNDEYLMISESRFIKDAAFRQKVDTVLVRKCFEEGQNAGGLYRDYREIDTYGFSYCAKDLGFVLLAEKDEVEILKPVSILQNRIFVAGIIIMIAMIVLTYFLSKLVSRPIIKLRDAANEIADGNFDIRTNIKTGDEIGQLSSAFDSMTKKIQESLIAIRQREDVIKQQQDVLLQFTDLSENYFVCFLDVIESTRLTANLTDLESSKLYSIFLNSMATIIRDFDGIVVKNIGDALLFYFPKTNTQDKDMLKKSLDCCLTLSDFNKEVNKRLGDEKLPSLEYKISAAYGSVRVAKIATSSIDDIFGSTVNRCAKINRFAPPNGLVIGDVLYQLIKDFDAYKFEEINDSSSEYGKVRLVTRKSS